MKIEQQNLNAFEHAYQLVQVVNESKNSKVYEAIQKSTNTNVVVKVHSVEFPTTKQLNKFRKEYEIGKIFSNCENSHILQYYNFLNLKLKNAIVMEKFGQSLASFLRKRGARLLVEEAIEIAIQISDAIMHIHENEIIHCGINPAHILIQQHGEKLVVKICDFGFSTDLRRDHAKPITSTKNDLDITYVSPEQTGRMNRDIDYRTDFYSLGVVLFEMLTGSPPFKSNDVLELIYYHIAQTPSFGELASQIPSSLQAVVQTLLSKSADDRYQCARGVRQDLQLCLQIIRDGEKAPFTPKRFDVCATFNLHQQLYGREQELTMLTEAFEKVNSGAVSRMMVLVSGYSGIGKTSLIQEVYKPLTKAKGYFISGKTDQLIRNIPFSSFIQAFKKLIDILLTEGEERLAKWKKKIMKALGQQAQVLIDLVPELKLVIGDQPPVPKLSGIESENRFKQLFQSLIEVFAQPEHPLVLFIDDLQWTDISTFKLLEEIMINSSIQHFLLFGSYRDNELDLAHPLRSSISLLKRHNVILEQISLKPLKAEHICQMIVDSFKTDRKKSMTLAGIIHAKTQGNPFFVIQMLHFLVSDKSIRFNFKEALWEWDLKRISAKGVTDNVIAMLINKIQKMSKQSQTILSLAAVIGNTFELATLSTIYEKSKEDTLNDLYPYVKEGMIIQVGESLRYLNEVQNMRFHFSHDKIQQASCELLSEEEQKSIHLRLGRVMMNTASNEENMFGILSHFHYAQDLLTDTSERLQVAEFSLQTSKKAKECSAFHSAARYVNFGISLLPPNSWEQHYQLTFDLYKQLCETEYLSRNYERAEQLYEIVAGNARTQLEKISIYSIKSSHFEALQRYHDAVMVILNSLKLLGICVPLEKEQIKEAIKLGLEEVKTLLAGRKMADFIDSPEMTTIEHKTALSLFVDTWSACYCYGDHDLLTLLSIMMAAYTMKYGHTEVSSVAYVIYSFVAGMYTGDYRHAYEAGQLGLQLLEKIPNEARRPRIYLIFAMGANNFIAPLRSSVPYLEKTHQLSVEYGDLNYASYSSHQVLALMFFSGEELQKLFTSYQYYIGYIRKYNPFIYRFGWAAMLGFRWLIEYDPGDEEEVTRAAYDNAELINIGVLAFGRVCRALWSRDSKHAVEYADFALQFCPGSITGCFHLIETYFYVAMVYLEYYNTFSTEKQHSSLKAIDMVISMYENFANDNPGTFKHKLLLLQGERHRVIMGKSDEFIDYIEEAIESATENEFLLFAALGQELLARYWVAKNRMKYAVTHIQSAFYYYDRCGAKAKIRYLIRTYPDQVKELKTTNVDLSENHDLMLSELEIDIHSVVKLSQAVSSEMNLEELLEHMMKIILENACSQRGIFILSEPGDKFLVVTETLYKPESHEASTHNAVKAIPLEKFSAIPKSIVNYVARTREPLIIGNALDDKMFGADPYFVDHNTVKSIICIPIHKQNEFKGVLYLENNSITNAFINERLKVISLLGVQFTLHLENSRFSTLLESEKKYKTLTAELQETKKKLEEFIDMLCHELRNPLNGIVGNQSILIDIHHSLQKLTLSNISRQDLIESISTYTDIFKETNESINISSNHMKDIIDTVLTVSMLDNKSVIMQNVPYNPKEVIPQIGLMFKTKLQEKNLEFKMILPNEDIIVVGDPYRLKEILINLVSNAIKFTQNGVICITMNILSRTENNIVFKFDIEDTGIGMTEEEQHRLFRSFSQANETTNIKYGGFGLGLKISKELVTLMGGEISVTSSKDKGTEFTFTISCALPSTPQEQNSSPKSAAAENIEPFTLSSAPSITTVVTPPVVSPAASTGQANGKHILIVEDNLINQRVLMQIVKLLGYSCITAFNGMEAFNTYKQCHADPNKQLHCIFMDIQMPIMNGYDAAQKIRNYEQENNLLPVPIVAVSANARPEHIKAALSFGMNKYITKPYNKHEIFSMLQSLNSAQTV